MRPPWVKEVRMQKSIKNVFNFSKNPGAFLSELSSATLFERGTGILPRDDDLFKLFDARSMSNSGLTDDEGEDIFALDLFLKRMKIAPTRTIRAHRATAYKMLEVDSGWYRYSMVGFGGNLIVEVGA